MTVTVQSLMVLLQSGKVFYSFRPRCVAGDAYISVDMPPSFQRLCRQRLQPLFLQVQRPLHGPPVQHHHHRDLPDPAAQGGGGGGRWGRGLCRGPRHQQRDDILVRGGTGYRGVDGTGRSINKKLLSVLLQRAQVSLDDSHKRQSLFADKSAAWQAFILTHTGRELFEF